MPEGHGGGRSAPKGTKATLEPPKTRNPIPQIQVDEVQGQMTGTQAADTDEGGWEKVENKVKGKRPAQSVQHSRSGGSPAGGSRAARGNQGLRVGWGQGHAASAATDLNRRRGGNGQASSAAGNRHRNNRPPSHEAIPMPPYPYQEYTLSEVSRYYEKHKMQNPIYNPAAYATTALSRKTYRGPDGKRIFPAGRNSFGDGDIIDAPVFSACLSRDLAHEESDRCIKTTNCGALCAKRRPLVVLFRFGEDMLCMPMYTFSGKGPAGKPTDIIHEFVGFRASEELCARQGVQFDPNAGNTTNFKPLVVEQMRNQVLWGATVHLTELISVKYLEQTGIIGKLDLESYHRLLTLWLGLSQLQVAVEFAAEANLNKTWAELAAIDDSALRVDGNLSSIEIFGARDFSQPEAPTSVATPASAPIASEPFVSEPPAPIPPVSASAASAPPASVPSASPPPARAPSSSKPSASATKGKKGKGKSS